MLRIAIGGSGGGTTAVRVIDATNPGGVLRGKVQVVLVISSRQDAMILQNVNRVMLTGARAVIHRPDFASNDEAYGEILVRLLGQYKPDLFAQLGWIPYTHPCVLSRYQTINQHPGPLDPGFPDFGGRGMRGKAVHAAVISFLHHAFAEDTTNKRWFTEATVHRATDELDIGEVIGRKRVRVLRTDDVTSLQARVLPEEHELVIETLLDIADGTVNNLPRENRLIDPKLYTLLDRCKEWATMCFPKG